MKRTVKILVISIAAIILSFVLIGMGISAFVSWTFGGVRFSPDAAMEAVGIGASEQKYIESEGCRFYYKTLADEYEDLGALGDGICEVTPVKKNGIGMWYANTNPRQTPLRAEGEKEIIASLISVEVNGKYHNFIIPAFVWGDTVNLPKGFPENCNSITLNGRKTELFKHSYFVSEKEISEFEIGNIKLTTKKFIGGNYEKKNMCFGIDFYFTHLAMQLRRQKEF